MPIENRKRREDWVYLEQLKKYDDGNIRKCKKSENFRRTFYWLILRII